MNPENCEAALVSSLSLVLDEATFVFGEPSPEPPEFDGPILESSLSFSGDASGRLVLRATETTAMELASALLGVDPGEANVDSATAAMGELLNMAAGVFMTELFGADVLVQLAPPTVLPSAEGGEDGDVTLVSFVTDDDQRLDFAVKL